ncbi:MAG: DNA mismatch repair endonuclease MutL [Eubacteriales bacterium]|nr:DNA mismatch repair endonuclease MutL [Eubacteriales bacterium]
MNKRINRLDPSVSNKIAAGEVVERPASVVKELIENSIDAGADLISVEIRDGGSTLIRVSDNGCGIEADDAAVAFERHTTSKIRDEKDLVGIVTMGFRGEALSSIAAVSRVELISRAAEGEMGFRAVNEGGLMREIKPYAATQGTTIRVSDLFFNTPARRKFLKKNAVETAHITDLMERYILGNPGISFRYSVNGQSVFYSYGTGVLIDAIEVVYGREVRRNLTPVEGSADGLRVTGYVGNQAVAASNRSRQSLFINGRYVRNPQITAAVEKAADTHFTIGHFPLYVLDVEVDPVKVDVNVHPNKMLVKFSDEEGVNETVYRLVAESLRRIETPVSVFAEEEKERPSVTVTETIAPSQESNPALEALRSLTVETDETPGNGGSMRENENPSAGRSAPPRFVYTPEKNVSEKKEEKPEPIRPFTEKEEAFGGSYRIVGVLFDTYIIIQKEDNVYFIDQHAAHERLLYEHFLRCKHDNVVSQRLLVPMIFKVSSAEFQLLDANAELLREMGFELEPFGAREYKVNAVPVIFGEPAVREFFSEFLSNADRVTYVKDLDLRRARLMQMACKRAVKGGDKLSDADIRALLGFIDAEKIPLSCPHGRPILVAMTRSELEKQFRRIN